MGSYGEKLWGLYNIFFTFFFAVDNPPVSNYQIERKKNNKPEKEASSFVRHGVLGLVLGKRGKRTGRVWEMTTRNKSPFKTQLF